MSLLDLPDLPSRVEGLDRRLAALEKRPPVIPDSLAVPNVNVIEQAGTVNEGATKAEIERLEAEIAALGGGVLYRIVRAKMLGLVKEHQATSWIPIKVAVSKGGVNWEITNIVHQEGKEHGEVNDGKAWLVSAGKPPWTGEGFEYPPHHCPVTYTPPGGVEPMQVSTQALSNAALEPPRFIYIVMMRPE